MPRVSKAISTVLLSRVEKALKATSKSGDVSRKLQAIKSAKKHGIKHFAEVFNTSRVAIMFWIKSFEKHGIEGLKLKAGRGRKSTISDVAMARIKDWILEDCNITIKELKIKIEEVLGKRLSISRVYQLMKKLRFAYITPRPLHYKRDEKQGIEFKKKDNR
jgi:transposase